MACEIDFNPVTLSWRSTVDNLGENIASPDRFAALRVKREVVGGESISSVMGCALEMVIKTLLNIGTVRRRAAEHVCGRTDLIDSGTMSGNFSV